MLSLVFWRLIIDKTQFFSKKYWQCFFGCLIPVQLPSGFIHWTVTVIPLACVIVGLICVIGFLLWRLKQRTRKQNGEITVNSIHYDVQTRSLLHQEGRVNNLRSADQMRVHFQEPNNHEGPKYHTLTQATNNETNQVEYAAFYKKPGEVPISRRLAIRRKNSSELTGKYPLNKDGNSDETEGAYRISHADTPNLGYKREQSLHEYHALASDYDEPLSIIKSDHDNTEKPDCSEDELSYLEIIPWTILFWLFIYRSYSALASLWDITEWLICYGNYLVIQSPT